MTFSMEVEPLVETVPLSPLAQALTLRDRVSAAASTVQRIFFILIFLQIIFYIHRWDFRFSTVPSSYKSHVKSTTAGM